MATHTLRSHISCQCTHPALDSRPFMPFTLGMSRNTLAQHFSCLGLPSVPRITLSIAWAHAQCVQRMGLCLIQCWCSYDSSWYVIQHLSFHSRLSIRTPSFVLGQSRLTARTAISVNVNTLIILSTIHSQDFRDQVGDKRAERWTIPMAWPEGSRVSILVIMTAWSVGLSWACGLANVLSVPSCIFTVFIGLRFIQKRTVDDDKLSYRYYNVRFQ